MKYEKLKIFVYNKLKTELSKHLYFHSVSHTFDDVLPAAIRIARTENVKKYDLMLLKTAVLFHDMGYINQYMSNEKISVEYAKEILPKYDYSEKEIEKICKLIMATETTVERGIIFQSATDDLLDQIICDADLDNLGRDDFFDLSFKLIKEKEFYGISVDMNEWWQNQSAFLFNHKYYTQTSKKERALGQQINLEKVQMLIKNSNK